jgi:hypothetical protein
MPSIQAFQKTSHKTKKKNSKSHRAPLPGAGVKKMSKAKRRPGREPHEENHTEASRTGYQKKHKTQEKPMTSNAKTPETHAKDPTEVHVNIKGHAESQTEAAPEAPKVEISFPGSEVLRAKWNRPFEVAERVATDWKNDGNFEGIPLGHPLAESIAAQGLKKAKEVEKKVVASGVIEKVATQALTFGMKAQQEIINIREQMKSKLGKK